jgi:hypothetical protein
MTAPWEVLGERWEGTGRGLVRASYGPGDSQRIPSHIRG